VSFWASLWGAPDLLNKTADAAISTGDKLWLTDEERQDYRERFSTWYLEYLRVSSGSDLARRLLAVMVTAVFLFLIVGTAALYVVGALTAEVTELPDGAISVAYNNWTAAGDKLFALISDALVSIELAIIGFYFTVRAVTNFANGKRGKH